MDLTRRKDHPTARLLDLIPGRSDIVYKNWLAARGKDFRARGCESRHWMHSGDSKNAIDDQLQDATSVLNYFGSSELSVGGGI